MAFVREYAHPRRPDFRMGCAASARRGPAQHSLTRLVCVCVCACVCARSERVDFAQTLLYHAGVTDAATGTAVLSFDLSDSVTTFCAMADAVHTQPVRSVCGCLRE